MVLLRVMCLRVIQVVAWISSLYWIPLFIYLLIDGLLDCFHFPAIMKKATMNVPCSGFMWTCSLGHVPKSGTAGSYCNSFLITLHIKVMFRTQIQCSFQCPTISLSEWSFSLALHCVVPPYCAQSSATPTWLFSSYCELLESRDTHSAFVQPDTSSTLPCIQQELYYVRLSGWRVLILRDRTYKIYLIVNVHFKMLTMKCLANNT